VYCLIPLEIVEQKEHLKDESIKEYHLLSDPQGLSLLQYELRDQDDKEYESAVSAACGHIIKAIEMHGFYESPERKLELVSSELKRKQSLLSFYWEFNRNIQIQNQEEKYNALCEAI
jgi:hypothetical protein